MKARTFLKEEDVNDLHTATCLFCDTKLEHKEVTFPCAKEGVLLAQQYTIITDPAAATFRFGFDPYTLAEQFLRGDMHTYFVKQVVAYCEEHLDLPEYLKQPAIDIVRQRASNYWRAPDEQRHPLEETLDRLYRHWHLDDLKGDTPSYEIFVRPIGLKCHFGCVPYPLSHRGKDTFDGRLRYTDFVRGLERNSRFKGYSKRLTEIPELVPRMEEGIIYIGVSRWSVEEYLSRVA